MTLHAFIAYLAYKWKAKGRHGTHSPFVYSLVEEALQNKGNFNEKSPVEIPELPLHYQILLGRIIAYFKYENWLVVTGGETQKTNGPQDLLLVHSLPPGEWADLLDRHFHLVQNDTAVFLTGMHQTKIHTSAWKQLCADQRVRMSIDIYGVGLLFFKKEFKEQQHFILKY